MENQPSLFGSLDTALGALERGRQSIERKLEAGNLRMRREDILRARKYIRSIEPQLRGMKGILREFESFAS